MKHFEEQIAAQNGTITVPENAVNEQDSQLAELQVNVASLTATVESLGKRCGDLEAHSRWNNVKLIGLPEGTVCPRLTDDVASFLQDLLGLEAKL